MRLLLALLCVFALIAPAAYACPAGPLKSNERAAASELHHQQRIWSRHGEDWTTVASFHQERWHAARNVLTSTNYRLHQRRGDFGIYDEAKPWPPHPWTKRQERRHDAIHCHLTHPRYYR